jgi:hypothetical protein
VNQRVFGARQGHKMRRIDASLILANMVQNMALRHRAD